MNALTGVFVTLWGASLALRLWLGQRNRAHVRSHRAAVPEAFRDHLSLEAHQKAADYTLAKERLAEVAAAVDGLVLLVRTLGGGLALLDRTWQRLDLAPLATGLGVVVSVGVVTALLHLPFSAYRIFVIDQRFDFNRMTGALFLADTLRRGGLALVTLAPLAGAVLWLMTTAGPLWWLYAWALWTGFVVVRLWAFPTLVAPLFNRFTPLRDPGLRDRIERLAARCGFSVGAVQVMDASRRSGHGNAYFAGLGASKRVVLFDTLLRALEPGEVEAVLAHELGHFRRRHLGKHFAAGALTLLAGLIPFAWLSTQTWFYAGLGVDVPSPQAALVLFVIIASVVRVFLQPLGALMLRRFETEADAYAARYGDAGALSRALVKLQRNNAATLTPDPLYAAFFYGHPPLPARLKRLAAARP